MKRTWIIGIVAALLVSMGVTATPANAQWRSDLAIYLWATGLDGTIGVRGQETDVSMSFSDILDDLEFGAFGAYSASNGDWAIQADGMIANIGFTEKGPQGVVRADVDVDITILEGDLGWEATDSFRLFAGARYVDLASDLNLRVGGSNVGVKGGESWVDPVVGFRWGTRPGDRWSFWLRGDVGGFGVGSDLSWNAVVAGAYHFNDRVGLGFGYRILDIDYEHGQGADNFKFDAQLSGLVTGVIFSF